MLYFYAVSPPYFQHKFYSINEILDGENKFNGYYNV